MWLEYRNNALPPGRAAEAFLPAGGRVGAPLQLPDYSQVDIESGPLRAVHFSRDKWPGRLVKSVHFRA